MTDKALLMGINNYRHISDLNGCENDVHNLYRLLTQHFDFNPSNIRYFMSEEVTKRTVLNGFDWLVADAQPGDRLVMHFSGHGSYVDSVNDDEEIDELICLYDMDIDDPETYLLDDELGELTKRVPPGVQLSIILDTCHSGTGTRSIATSTRSAASADAPLAIISDTVGRAAEMGSPVLARTRSGGGDLLDDLLEDKEQTVLARVYLPPNQSLQQRKMRSRIHRFGRSADNSMIDLNHQLLASAAAEQTAADAHIDGDFHGAFTYHLCQAVRDQGSDSSLRSIMESAMNKMNGAGFAQTPQNEGPYADDPLFGERANAFIPGRPGEQTAHDESAPQREAADGAASTGELLTQALRMAEKLIDLADRMEQQGSGRRTARPSRTRSDEEALVCVHGISRHVDGYSKRWLKSIAAHLTISLDHHEVLWSPVVNRRSSSRSLSPQAQEFAEQVKLLMEDRQQQEMANLPGASRGTAHLPTATSRGSNMSVDDFSRYMYNKAERNEILDIFHSVVHPLLADGRTINLIAHSWGTVVTWEGLWHLNAQNLPGRVKNLFVVGAALSMWPVQQNLFNRIGDGKKPDVVQNVYNLDAKGDIVGGRIGNKFTVTNEYLNLDNLGCAIWDVGCAHGSYFVEDNLAVNRDIFAKILNG